MIGLVLAFLAGPAAATEAPETAAGAMAGAVEACVVEANRDPAAELACRGVAASACLDAAAEPTPEVAAACTAAEAEGWRTLAAQTAGALVVMADELGVGGEGAGQAALVARAQRAWAEFRDADCAQLGALAEPGAARDGVVATCRLDRSAERALALLARRRAMESP